MSIIKNFAKLFGKVVSLQHLNWKPTMSVFLGNTDNCLSAFGA